MRSLLVDYDVTIAIVVTTLVSYTWTVASSQVERITLPADISPTCYHESPSGAGPATIACLATHEHSGASILHRPWTPSFEHSSFTLWAVALISAIPITFFFYMDQNISSLLCQLPEMHLKHGHYFNTSFMWMGIFNAIGPFFGLPFVTGSLPHSPQFVRALTILPTEGSKAPPFVAENRVAPLLMYAMLGLPLLFPAVLEVIPRAAINGVLAYVGVEGILTTQLFSRTLLLLSPPASFPKPLAALGVGRVHTYTLLQLTLLGLCWLVNISPLGLGVAFIIVSLVPLRAQLLPYVFTADELAALD